MRSLFGLKRTPHLSSIQVSQMGNIGVLNLDPRLIASIFLLSECQYRNPNSFLLTIPTFPSPNFQDCNKYFIKSNNHSHQSFYHNQQVKLHCDSREWQFQLKSGLKDKKKSTEILTKKFRIFHYYDCHLIILLNQTVLMMILHVIFQSFIETNFSLN